jgi:NADH:ubiquinone oxidoreductase subunit
MFPSLIHQRETRSPAKAATKARAYRKPVNGNDTNAIATASPQGETALAAAFARALARLEVRR